MAYLDKTMNIACENCGQANPPPAVSVCSKCGNSFAFLDTAASTWEPWDYSQWLFANHFQIAELAERDGYVSLSRSQQLNFFVGYFYYQLMNGGLWQYFQNPYGPDAPKLVEALQEIGAPQTAAAISEALEFFPNRQPQQDDEERESSIEAVREKDCERLDDLATKLVNGEDSPEDLLALLQRRCAALENRTCP